MFLNPEIELAFQFIAETNTNVFLTGKAGTGKTTFLRRVKNEVNKRMAIVAPTGVAAINAEGVTIHSLFQLPFGPILPGQATSGNNQRFFNRKKINLLKSLDLLIIDEISMVRADVLDAIDNVLKKYRTYAKPFGGVQVLMIGDLHQLPPVVQGDEWNMLKEYYDTAYFFGSKALKETDSVTIHLKHIYRQQDQEFIELLNRVRNNQIDEGVLHRLNTRYVPDFVPEDEEGYITLTSHNTTANRINEERLKDLEGKSFIYEAEVSGDFPEQVYPTSYKLELKVGAQVMFVKNDLSEEKRFFNGKIGQVVGLTKNSIQVECPGEDEWIEVESLTWENRRFNLNESTKMVEEEIVGGFKQYPLKLAWGITIHKSQGLTFDKVIIDAKDAFAHGQVYVALSRCKTFEGIILRTPIGQSAVKTDVVVKSFTELALEEQPDAGKLFQAKKAFQSNLLVELFQFLTLDRNLEQFKRLTLMHADKLQNDLVQEFEAFQVAVVNDIIRVGHRFINELSIFFTQAKLPEENEELKERLSKAMAYFVGKLDPLTASFETLQALTDNREIEASFEEKSAEIRLEFTKIKSAFKVILIGFNAKLMQQAIANAEIDAKERPKSTPKKIAVPKEVKHKELYAALVKWRLDMANENNYSAYRVLSNKTLLEIVEVLPTSKDALGQIKGFGKVKLKSFGSAIVKIVQDFCVQEGLDAQAVNLLDFATGTPPKKEKEEVKVDTKRLSFDMYKTGKCLSEIAEERQLAQTTIESHLSYYVGNGEISVFDFVSADKVTAIVKYFAEVEDDSLSKAKENLDHAYSYTELRMACEHWKWVMSKVN